MSEQAITGRAPTAERPESDTLSLPIQTARKLIVRLGLCLAVGLAVVAGVVLYATRVGATSHAETNARERAQLMARIALPRKLSIDANTKKLRGQVAATLDHYFGRELARGAIVSAAIYRADGKRVYTIGHRTSRSESPTVLAQALGGRSLGLVRERSGGNTLATYTALVPQSEFPSVVVVEQEYAPITRDAKGAFQRLFDVLPGALVCLFLLFIPILSGVLREIRRQMRLIKHHALHDDLTDLPNRALFHDRVEHALAHAKRDDETVAVMVLDLDRFKDANDEHGHHVGDAILEDVGRRLRETVRAGDTVARLGGDEFGVLSTGTRDAVSAMGLAERIAHAIEEPLRVGDVTFDLKGSIGIALYPAHGETVEELLRNADAAMYAAKQRGTEVELFVKTGDDEERRVHVSLIGDFRRALDESELVVHYQPSLDIHTGAPSTIEALVRWNHPERGLLMPGDFVPVIEQTSLIHALTTQVLEQGLEWCRDRLEAGHDVRLSFNLSPRNLQDQDLAGKVGELLRKWAIAPGRVDFEVTESALVSSGKRAMHTLNDLRKLGIGIVFDGFGTGYSSLTFLRNLSVDAIKVDRSFVGGLTKSKNDSVIVRSVVDLAHNLGMRVIAEGVEDEEIWTQLVALGCDSAQGLYVSEPLPADEITAWLDGRTGSDDVSIDAVA